MCASQAAKRSTCGSCSGCGARRRPRDRSAMRLPPAALLRRHRRAGAAASPLQRAGTTTAPASTRLSPTAAAPPPLADYLAPNRRLQVRVRNTVQQFRKTGRSVGDRWRSAPNYRCRCAPAQANARLPRAKTSAERRCASDVAPPDLVSGTARTIWRWRGRRRRLDCQGGGRRRAARLACVRAGWESGANRRRQRARPAHRHCRGAVPDRAFWPPADSPLARVFRPALTTTGPGGRRCSRCSMRRA